MPRTMPGIGTVLGVIQQRLEEWRLDAFQIAFRLADDVTRHEFGRVLEHVDETVQLAQDVVGQMPAGLGLAIDIDRHIRVLPAYLLDEAAQVQHHGIKIGTGAEFLVVDRQKKGAGAGLLLRELGQIAIACHAQNLEALVFNGLCQGTDTKPRCVLGTVVFVDDDDGEAKFHVNLLSHPV